LTKLQQRLLNKLKICLSKVVISILLNKKPS
jgi:hypothetical protein